MAHWELSEGMIAMALGSRRVLRDAALDRRLRRDGYVTAPFVSAEQARSLAATYHSLRPVPGSGFDPDLENHDIAYRRRVAAVLSPVIGPAVERFFVHHRPFLWNYICKWPGDDDDLYIHRDWMFVDERRGARTYVAWVALQDVAGDNGVLRVVPRSHRLEGELAGTNLHPHWVAPSPVVEERLVTVPVPIGTAVVFDNALMHCSYRNATATARLAVGCAVRSPDDALVHFRRVDDTCAVRYDVDDDFFIETTPAQLMEAAPRIEVAEQVTIPERPFSADEMSRRLDGRRLPRLRPPGLRSRS